MYVDLAQQFGTAVNDACGCIERKRASGALLAGPGIGYLPDDFGSFAGGMFAGTGGVLVVIGGLLLVYALTGAPAQERRRKLRAEYERHDAALREIKTRYGRLRRAAA